jgi:hypothetical protein
MGGVLSKPISSAITSITGAKTYGDAVKQIQGKKPIEGSAGAEKKEEAKEVSETKRLLRVKRKGRSATVLSSSSGVTDEASVAKKTLLGA